jgi:hypothetical protein
MNTRKHQGGFLLIAAVFLIVAAAVAAAAMAFFVVSGGQSAAGHLTATQALFIAEAGIEKGSREWSLNNAYTGETNTPFAKGVFTVTTDPNDFNGNPLPAGQIRLRSVGTVSGTSATRTAEAILGEKNLLPASANTNFNQAPLTPCNYDGDGTPGSSTCYPTGWKLDPAPPSIFQPWDKAPPDAEGPQQSGGPDGSRAAYAEKTSSGPSTATNAGNFTFSPAVTVTAPTTVQMDFDYRVVRSSPGGPPNEMQLTFTLSDGVTTWTATPAPFESGDTGTFQSGTVTFAITGTGTKNITNLEFTIHLKSGQPKQAWLDNLELISGTPTYEIKAWQEVFP